MKKHLKVFFLLGGAEAYPYCANATKEFAYLEFLVTLKFKSFVISLTYLKNLGLNLISTITFS